MKKTTSAEHSRHHSTPYGLIGGEPVVRALSDRFYELMDSVPEARTIRRMHPADLAASREKLFMFLSGWLGGPPLYAQAHGHPFLRARHLPFRIGEAERDAWLACMRQALDETVTDQKIRQRLFEAFFSLADHMRNRPR